jgi:hypothetical protein
MKILLPIDVDDSILSASNVVEDVAEYNASTLYMAGDQIRDEDTHTLYESLIGTNAGTVTVTIASPAVVSLPNHGLSANTPVLLQTTGALPTGLTAGTIYYVTSPIANSFNLSATAGGAAINTSGTQSGTHTLIVEPNKNYPITDLSRWLDVGPTNRWAMFDRKLGTVTEKDGSIDVDLVASQRIGGLALFNTDAFEINVTITDALEGVVYDQTFSMVSYDNVANYYDYFFAPILRKRDIFIEGLPLYLDAIIHVSVSRPESTARVGNLVVGTVRDLGTTTMGAGFGIIDYSRKEADDFGNVDLTERDYRSTGSFEVVVERLYVDEIKNLLTQRRALPTVYIGTEEFSSMLIYGFARDWNVKVNEYRQADLSLELESLT